MFVPSSGVPLLLSKGRFVPPLLPFLPCSFAGAANPFGQHPATDLKALWPFVPDYFGE